MMRLITAITGIGFLAFLIVAGIRTPSAFQYEANAVLSQQALSQEPLESVDRKILFVGDIMLGRHVETLLERHGQEYPFERIREVLVDYDEIVANVEGPIMREHVPTPSGSTRFSFGPYASALLRDNAISIVSLANNHTFDFGKEGFNETTRFLDEAGVAWVGHPFSLDSEYVLQKKIGDMLFIFFSFNVTNPHFETEKATLFVKTTLMQNRDAVGVALLHWGEEYTLTSNKAQQNFAHSLVDAGVGLIIGHHPHVVQEIEQYQDGIIFYSLGNFVFDQYFSTDVEEGLAVEFKSSPSKTTFLLHPIESAKSQPAFMVGLKKERFLADLAARSPESIRASIMGGVIPFTYK